MGNVAWRICSVRHASTKFPPVVIGANSAELHDRILSKIPNDPRKTKQILSVLHLCVGERTEIALNVRTDDGLTIVNIRGGFGRLANFKVTREPSTLELDKSRHMTVKVHNMAIL